MHHRVSVNAVCFRGSTLSEIDAIWHEMAAKHVSFTSGQVLKEGEEAALAVLKRGGYVLEAVAHGFVPGALENDEASWQRPRANLSRIIQFAKAAGGRSIYMLTGGRGRRTWEEAAAVFSAAIAPCVAEAQAAGIRLLIEPASFIYAGLHLAHSLRDTVALAERAGIGVCIDLFAAWTEAGLRETIQRAIPRAHLVQVCDYVSGDASLPARAVPGDGDIPLRRICGWLLDGGYQGSFELELLGPRIDEEGRAKAVSRAARYMTDLLEELGT